MLVQSEYLSFLAETKIGDASANQYLAEKISSFRPDMNPVSASAIDVAIQITLNAVWDSLVCKREKASVS